MRAILFFFLIAITIINCNNFPYCDPFDTYTEVPTAPKDVGHLKLVQVIIRHGARTPVVAECPLSNSEWTCSFTSSERPNFAPGSSLYNKMWINGRNFYPGSCGKGVLTSLGYNQQIQNGVFLRNLYISNSSFLPDTINANTFNDKFYVRSTDVPRTFLSGESLLTGLYPPEKRDGDFSININTMDQATENLVANGYVCPRVSYMENLFKNSALYKNHTMMVTLPLQKRIATVLGLTSEQISIASLFDCWISDICHGYAIPKAITNELLMEVIREGEWQYGQMYQYPNRYDWVKPGIGTFMKEYLHVIQNARNDPSSPLQFVLYSAHDTTIMPVLVALNAWNNLWPTFASHIITEYYEGPNPSVRILYNGKPITLPDCGQVFCPYDKFESIVNKVIPTTAECKSTSFTQEKEVFSFNSFN